MRVSRDCLHRGSAGGNQVRGKSRVSRDWAVYDRLGCRCVVFTSTGNLPARGHHGNPQGARERARCPFMREWVRGVEGAASPIHRQTGNQGHRRRARTTRVDSGARRHQYGARTQGSKGAGSSRASSGSATSSSNWGEAASKDASGAKQAGIKDTGVKGTGEEANSTLPRGPSIQQEHRGTLGLDLGGRARLSKPRGLGIVDEIMWGEAQQLAIQEIAVLFSVPTDIQLYYSNMCKVGQQALAAQIHIKTQAIYDARCAQKMSRERRRMK